MQQFSTSTNRSSPRKYHGASSEVATYLSLSFLSLRPPQSHDHNSSPLLHFPVWARRDAQLRAPPPRLRPPHYYSIPQRPKCLPRFVSIGFSTVMQFKSLSISHHRRGRGDSCLVRVSFSRRCGREEMISKADALGPPRLPFHPSIRSACLIARSPAWTRT